MEIPLVHILVLNYCALADTLECIEQVRRISYPRFRLLVIDNNSPDLSGQKLGALLPQVEFLQTGHNYGYAGGNNIGIARALREGAEYILILNPDVRIPRGVLEDYVSILSRDRAIAALNSIQLQEDGVSIDESFIEGVLARLGYGDCGSDFSRFPEVAESEALFGAALFISAAALRSVGGFDPLYFAYGEESDLCARLRMHGYKLAVTARSPVLHLRTKRGTVSTYVLFLKLRGYYLRRIKSPHANGFRELTNAIGIMIREILRDSRRAYPFNKYEYSRCLIVRVILSLLLLFPIALLHKAKERRPGAHYIAAH